MATFARGGSQRNRTKSQARMTSRGAAKNKDKLKSDRDGTMGRNPAVKLDQFGSRHHADLKKEAQRRGGRPAGGGAVQDLSFRESAQDQRVGSKGARNRTAGRRGTRKRGGPVENRREE